jgi:hypothetical protein
MSCTKKPYTKVEAQGALNAANSSGRMVGIGRIYKCEHCPFWHLTHQPKRAAEGKKNYQPSQKNKWLELLNQNQTICQKTQTHQGHWGKWSFACCIHCS